MLFAVFPFSQQSVAWAGAHQPLATAALLTAVWAFVRAVLASYVEFTDQADRWRSLPGPPLVLFVNFPEGLWLDKPPLPLGRWGVLVAQIDTDLSAFARHARGGARPSESLSLPMLDHQPREEAPLMFGLRGIAATAEMLAAVCAGTRAWLASFSPPSRFELVGLVAGWVDVGEMADR